MTPTRRALVLWSFAQQLAGSRDRFLIELFTGDVPVLFPAVQTVRTLDEWLQVAWIAEFVGDVCPDEVRASSGIEGSVRDLAGDPMSHRPLRGPGVSRWVEGQPQFFQHLVEESRGLGFLAAQ